MKILAVDTSPQIPRLRDLTQFCARFPCSPELEYSVR